MKKTVYVSNKNQFRKAVEAAANTIVVTGEFREKVVNMQRLFETSRKKRMTMASLVIGAAAAVIAQIIVASTSSVFTGGMSVLLGTPVIVTQISVLAIMTGVSFTLLTQLIGFAVEYGSHTMNLMLSKYNLVISADGGVSLELIEDCEVENKSVRIDNLII